MLSLENQFGVFGATYIHWIVRVSVLITRLVCGFFTSHAEGIRGICTKHKILFM
ncbi:hypothetical protein Hanom_Chr08g00744481 [Helianthus anomalus]